MKKNAEVSACVDRIDTWRDETERLRSILLDHGLSEHLKWGKPCYSSHGTNVAIIQGFKDHCSLMFFKGALLEDTNGILTRPGPNSRAAMRVEFTSVGQINELESVLRSYVAQAVGIEEAGLKVEFKGGSDVAFPDEFASALEEDRALDEAFRSLTPGRQRGYLLHFSAAKQSKTRAARVERSVEKILAGKGLNDR